MNLRIMRLVTVHCSESGDMRISSPCRASGFEVVVSSLQYLTLIVNFWREEQDGLIRLTRLPATPCEWYAHVDAWEASLAL